MHVADGTFTNPLPDPDGSDKSHIDTQWIFSAFGESFEHFLIFMGALFVCFTGMCAGCCYYVCGNLRPLEAPIEEPDVEHSVARSHQGEAEGSTSGLRDNDRVSMEASVSRAQFPGVEEKNAHDERRSEQSFSFFGIANIFKGSSRSNTVELPSGQRRDPGVCECVGDRYNPDASCTQNSFSREPHPFDHRIGDEKHENVPPRDGGGGRARFQFSNFNRQESYTEHSKLLVDTGGSDASLMSTGSIGLQSPDAQNTISLSVPVEHQNRDTQNAVSLYVPFSTDLKRKGSATRNKVSARERVRILHRRARSTATAAEGTSHSIPSQSKVSRPRRSSFLSTTARGKLKSLKRWATTGVYMMPLSTEDPESTALEYASSNSDSQQPEVSMA